MKQRKVQKEEIEYYDKCSYCKKEIIGRTENQVSYNLQIHINAKHKEGKKK